MAKHIAVEVWGDHAIFTRPEMKMERVSYEAMTPSAARGILDAIYWHKGYLYVIDYIQVCNPIRFVSIKRNEIKQTISARTVKTLMNNHADLQDFFIDSNNERQQRFTMYLRDVRYIIHAHLDVIDAEPGKYNEKLGKGYGIFNRRLKSGGCFANPYLGCRECGASFKEYEPGWGNFLPPDPSLAGERDLGTMLWDMDYNAKHVTEVKPMFFHPIMKDGVIKVPHISQKGVEIF